MHWKYILLESKAVAVTDIHLDNIITLDIEQVSNPAYQIGIIIEIMKNSKQITRSETLLLLNSGLYHLFDQLDEHNFLYNAIESASPQLETIIEKVIGGL